MVKQAKGDEIRTLFGRLQEGINLNPPEKRNAIISPIGRHIDSFALNHQFFQNSKISSGRYKRQDYLAHAITLMAYNNNQDLKADLILKLYLDKDFKLTQNDLKIISEILDFIHEVDHASDYRIYKKFHFIDFFWLLFNNYDRIQELKATEVANKFDTFEEERLNTGDPKLLIEKEDSGQKDQDLYDYIMAFKYDGSSPESINTRNKVYKSLFLTKAS